MNLLYIWNSAYSGEERNEGYLLSGRYEITFTGTDRLLSIRRREAVFAEGFWGEHVCDVMAVVGCNGAGKTQLAYYIMETLDEASRISEAIPNSQQSWFHFLLVFEGDGGGEPEIEIFTSGLELTVDTQLGYEIYSRQGDLKRFKFAYFTDALSPLDYRYEKYGVVHDGSLGGNIRQSLKYNREMHYINNQRDPVINYFNNEMEDILEFVCFDKNQEGIPFALPKRVTFSPVDFWVNLNYISDELDRMGNPNGKDILRGKCIEIQKKYGQNMCSILAIHLMLNLFKAFCIPQASSEDLSATAEFFLEKINHLECCSEGAFDVVLRLLDEVRADRDSVIISRYQNALHWMKKQSALQGDRWKRMLWRLDLEEERETVLELFSHYRETNFPYPYLSVSFGLSTGEYAFLRRFVRINELLSKNSRGQAYVMNNLGYEVQCSSVMLYLDEADQSLHPEWQRKYLDWLLQFVSARFKTCSVQLVIATHSPIMLSDIPQNHVLYLRNNGREIQAERRLVRTFGSNIHTLFRDAFFLEEGTMGAFAERKINEIARSLRSFGNEVPPETLQLVEEIGDDVIRGKLRQMCEVRPLYNSMHQEDQTIKETLRLLRSQSERLEAAIRELEHMRYDQD